ncbi:transmembrane protein 254-like [Watersipora subatra]|uniref:transmembrane protein 254-like n=1 Tax=Watersipora subatra TaxID=2589382 RepID=UPI00355C077C
MLALLVVLAVVMKGAKDVEPDWFCSVHVGLGAFIVAMLGYTELLYFCPEVLPLHYFGPLGSLGGYMVKETPRLLAGICIGANIIHACEGVYAFILSRRLHLNVWTTFKWTLQTTIFGILSLSMIYGKTKSLDKTS